MTGFVMPAPTREEVRRGILYVVASIFVFALTNALIKWLVVRYAVVEVIVFRSGKVAAIKGTVLDEAGAYGLKAQVLTSKALMVAGSIAGSFISGYAASQQTTSQNAFGFIC